MKDLRTSRTARAAAFVLAVLCLTAALCCTGPLAWLNGMGAADGYKYYMDRVEELLLENRVDPVLSTVFSWEYDKDVPEDAAALIGDRIREIRSWIEGDPNVFFTIRGEDGRLLLGSDTLGDYRAKYAQTVTLPETVRVNETYDTAARRDAALDALREQYDQVSTAGLEEADEGPFLLNAVCVSYEAGEAVTVSGFIRADMEPAGPTWNELNRAAALCSARTVYQVLIPAGIVIGLLCLAFLFWAAGHKTGEEGIVLNGFDRKIPVDLLLPVGLIALISWLAIALDPPGWRLIPDRFPTAPFVVLSLTFAFGLYALLSAVRRVKAGEIRKGSLFFAKAGRLCAGGFRRIGRELGVLADKLPLFWLAAAVFLAFALAEGLAVVAIREGEFGGVLLWFLCKAAEAAGIIRLVLSFRRLQAGGRELAAGNLDYQVPLDRLRGPFREHGENLNSIRAAIRSAVEEQMKSERMKTELITNVSHDIKTPLTSIVSYVDLLKKQPMATPEAEEYLEVLDRQSARLKKLTEDLVEASKASTGNIPVDLQRTDVNVLLAQSAGEYQERLKDRDLTLVLTPAEGSPAILADGRLLWRVFDNLLSNIRKYAQPGTRVYLTCQASEDRVTVLFRNISAAELNISAGELMERFVRGDRSRSTEGSGLGLSIARSLTQLQGGTFDLSIDGDLFKAVLTFPRAE